MDTGDTRVPMMRDLFLNPSVLGKPWLSPEMRIAHEMQVAHERAAAQTTPSKATGKRVPRRRRGVG